MQLFVLVLNKIEYLEDILVALKKAGVRGATIIDSMGIGRALSYSSHRGLPFVCAPKAMIYGTPPFNKTIFSVMEDEQVPKVIEAVKSILGDMTQPGVGILFTVPVSNVEGLAPKMEEEMFV